MDFTTEMLSKSQTALKEIDLPRRVDYTPSPVDWADEVIYFLLPDRFSDENTSRSLLNRDNRRAARPNLSNGENWRWDKWKESGGQHFQGGTIKGIISRLNYLQKLGISALWVGPVFKQRGHLDTYHGYAIQNFLEVDPRFGDRQDLISLVKSAHEKGIRVILDIVFNHSGANFLYASGTPGKVCSPLVDGRFEAQYTDGQYQSIQWRGGDGNATATVNSTEDGVWPEELLDNHCFTRAGTSCDIGAGNINDPHAVHKRTDFFDLRDFDTSKDDVLTKLAKVYQYWIALTDCDGFRLDTVKHVTKEEARNFCGAIKEYAHNIGKRNFFLVAEVAGEESGQNEYLNAIAQNLNATLDIGDMKGIINGVSKGFGDPENYFRQFKSGEGFLGSHRQLRNKLVSILEQHDDKIRYSVKTSSEHQVVAGTAMQLFSLGIPCIYYGTEQAFAGPEESEQQWLFPEWGAQDTFTREAMFGPEHPRKHGADGLRGDVDNDLPGFGPFGTSGHHCFDENHPAFVRIAALIAQRKKYPALRLGRQVMRPVSLFNESFNDQITYHRAGEIVAWSRLLNDEEMLIIVNSHGLDNRGGDILVDAKLNPPGSEMTVIANTEEAATPNFNGSFKAGTTVKVKRRDDGNSYIEIRDVKPSEVIILSNHP